MMGWLQTFDKLITYSDSKTDWVWFLLISAMFCVTIEGLGGENTLLILLKRNLRRIEQEFLKGKIVPTYSWNKKNFNVMQRDIMR